ncbi:helix-turn-helix domain-containing protein [Sphingomonas oryzagri]
MMDEAGERAADPIAEEPKTVGARLRAAREARGQSLEDIGRQTRVPVRHLVQIEEGRLDGLPAAPYSAGFVKSYARAVDLDPMEMSQQFRAEFAAAAQASPRIAYEPYEPAEPVRLPPRLLAFVALAIAVLLVLGYGIWRSGILTGEGADQRAQLAASGEPMGTSGTPSAAPGQPAAPRPAAPVGGAVRLTATQDTWFEVTDKASGTRLYTGVLKQGQGWDVPPSAGDPVIKTGRPEGLTVTVGGQPVAPLGEPAHTISNVSLKAASLAGHPAPAQSAAVPPATAMAPQPRQGPPAPSAATPPAAGDVPPAFQATVAPANSPTTTPHP